MEDEDLAEFLALASVAPASVGGASSASDVVVERASASGPPLQDAEAEPAEEVAELLALAAIAAPKKQAFERQSPELMAHARRQLELKRNAGRLDEERAKRRKAELQLAVVAQADAGAQLILGASAKRLPKEIAAGILVKIACLPRIRSALFEQLRKRETRALGIVASCLRMGRDAQWQRLVSPCSPMPQEALQRILLFSVQWDETAQRFRASRPGTSGGKAMAKRTGAPLAAQVIVISGRMLGVNLLGEGVRDDPYIMNTVVVAETSANILAEGLVRALPFAFEDPEEMRVLSTRLDFFVFSMTVDFDQSGDPAGALCRRVSRARHALDPVVVWRCRVLGAVAVGSAARPLGRDTVALGSVRVVLGDHLLWCGCALGSPLLRFRRIR